MDMCNLTTLKGMSETELCYRAKKTLEDFDKKYLNENKAPHETCEAAMKTGSAKLITNYKDMSNSVNNTARMVMDIYGEIRQIKKDIKELKIQIEELMQAKNSDKASLCLEAQQDKYINNIGGK